MFGASRSASAAAPWTHFNMDVTDGKSVKDAVASVLARSDRIDAVVHCAGVSLMAPFEAISPAEASKHFEINYFGAVRVLQAVAPAMRRGGSGKLIVVGSIAGLIGLPFLSHYCAAKSALDRYIESIRPELSGIGIAATVVHPGNFKTGFSSRPHVSSGLEEDTAFLDKFKRHAELYRRYEVNGSPPAAFAEKINDLLERKQLPPRVVVGSTLETIGVIAKRLMPSRLFEKGVGTFYGPG